MVALSVSISAINSPAFTVSPTFLCQAAITPSVMVSLILGMSTISALMPDVSIFSAPIAIGGGATAVAATLGGSAFPPEAATVVTGAVAEAVAAALERRLA